VMALKKKQKRDTMPGIIHLKRKLALIPVSQLLAKTDKSAKLFCEELKTRGYACLKTDCPDIKKISEDLTSSALAYLSQSLLIKEQNKSPLLNANVGYVHIPDIREYIKLRPSDPLSLWPQYPDSFEKSFLQFHKEYSKIAIRCFNILSDWVDYDEPIPVRYIKQGNTEELSKLLEQRSSLSMIKYYPLEKDTEVCDEHTDTGVMTFITRTHRPALEIWDRSEKKYVKIEELLDEGDIVVFISEKVPLFSGSMRMKPTRHRVRMSAGPERLSIAYLLDTSMI